MPVYKYRSIEEMDAHSGALYRYRSIDEMNRADDRRLQQHIATWLASGPAKPREARRLRRSD